MRSFFLAIITAGLFTSCDTTTTTVATSCSVEIHSPSSEILETGEIFQIEGSPLTTHFDTAAYIGAHRATVLEVDRDSCDECDSCRDEAECNLCEDCDECDELCDATCVEIARIQVPELSQGSLSLQLFNHFGQSNSLPLEIVRSPPADPAQPLDTASDTGFDSGNPSDTSAQPSDSGSVDDTGSGQDDSATPPKD